MVLALKPIHEMYGIKRIVVSTYQAVSGAGQSGVNELVEQTRQVLNGEKINPSALAHQIAFNLIPQINDFEENGFTKEEMKMVDETKKLLEDPSIEITPTCVHVPVLYGHSESIYVETEKPYDLKEVKRLLENAKGLTVQDNPEANKYPMPVDAEGTYSTYVGRMRRDLSNPNGLNMWVVSDNVLKGAALNAVQIAEEIIK